MPTPEEMKEYQDFLLNTGSSSNAELEKIANELLSANQVPSAVEESRSIGKQIASSLIQELKDAGFMKLAEDPSINSEVVVKSNVAKPIKPEETKPHTKANPATLVEQIMNEIGAVAAIKPSRENAETEEAPEEEEEKEKEANELLSKVAAELVDMGMSDNEANDAAETLLKAYADAIEDKEEQPDEMTAEGSELDEQAAYYLLGQQVGEAILNRLQ
jgi:hypothetical protein